MASLNLFKTKICGITSSDDARHAIEAGSDAIGLNFFAESPRGVSREIARQIIREVAGEIQIVGVFVNHSAAEIADLSADLKFDYCQLHGDETPEYASRLPESTIIIPAIRVGETDYQLLARRIASWQQAGAAAVLLDPRVDGQYGGTGKQLDWKTLPQIAADLPLILAGGLNCHNVTQAISEARPSAVDVASGVESSPGVKDPDLMDKFICAAHLGFDRLDA